MLISVHMPKTAGLSFRATLEEHYGPDFAADYADYPLAHAPQERHRMALQFGLDCVQQEFGTTRCIHGHFLPLKYLPLADLRKCRFVTWLREPVARLVSHFAYWQRSYDPASDLTSALHRRVVEEGWSLKRFCLSAELRNIYSQFLWGFPLQGFDFVGITEFYDEDLRYFSTLYLGKNAEARYVNQRTDDPEDRLKTQLTTPLRREIETFHAADLVLYRQALAMRSSRLGTN